jgi:subtilisin-like proprotein convertase family protein
MLRWPLVPRLALSLGLFALIPHPAPAQHNPDRIVVPATGLASHYGAARTYPSVIDVAPNGEPGPTVHSVSVILHNVTHSCFQDLDIVLVGPDGTAVTLMSDVGGCTLLEATRTLVFTDEGFPLPESSLPADGGTYAPTNGTGPWADSYPPPMPATVFAASLGAFKSKQPDGQWRLFVVDDEPNNRGEIQAWTLALRTVRFFADVSDIDVPVSGATVGVGSPYPAIAVASNVAGRVDQVNAYVRLRHQDPDDVDLLLVGPGGQKTLLMSDVGGYADLPGPGVSLEFDDTAMLAMPDSTSLSSKTYAPTDYAPAETFEAPAPPGPYQASLAVFRGAQANGSWSLYARDDATAGTGSIDQWGIWIVTVSPPEPPMFSLEVPASFSTSSPFVRITADVDDPTDALLTWRNAANGATGVATHDHTSIFGATVPVLSGSNAITFTLTNAAGEQTSKTTTVLVSSFTYTFSEGATGPLFDLDLAVFNPNNTSTQFTVRFLTPTASPSPMQKDYVLAARSRLRIPVETLTGEFPAVADSAVSAVLSSVDARPLVAERTMFWDATRYGGHAGSAVSEASTLWLFAEGSQGFFETFVLLSNENSSDAAVTVTFLLESGTPVVKTYTVAARTRLNVWAAVVPELVNRSFGITVTSSLPITAERAMYFTGSGTRLFEGGHESAGVTRGSRGWFFAEGATGPYFDTYILVSNPWPSSMPVTFTYRTPSGTVVTKTLTAGPQSRLTVNVEDQDALLANTAVSTTVSAPLPVVAERAMYWPGGAATWFEAHNAFGLTETGSRWAVADGRVGGPEQFETYMLLVNPEPVDAHVTMTFARLGLASPVQKSIVLPANSRTNVTLATHAPEVLAPSGTTEFSAIVETANLTRIAVERATYWNSGGVPWAGGANVTGTRLQ